MSFESLSDLGTGREDSSKTRDVREEVPHRGSTRRGPIFRSLDRSKKGQRVKGEVSWRDERMTLDD